VRNRVFPGAIYAARWKRDVVHVHAAGLLTYEEDAAAVGAETVYDLASLTKVMVTTTAAMILVDEGALNLDASVAHFLPEARRTDLDHVTLAHLLSHSAGLPAWAPLYLDTKGPDEYVRRIAATALERPPGTVSVYSDLGFILLGVALERAIGETLDAFASRRIFRPLRMSERTGFRPPASLQPEIAPTEDDPWRGRLVRGEVHDENAFALGGVAGHAGLFGPMTDVMLFVLAMADGGAPLVQPETLDRFAAPCGVPGSSFGLGWDRPSGETSTAGRLLSRASIGHLGFTGTSFWIERESGTFVILLSNSVHPRRGNAGLRQVRGALADAVAVGRD
jgi:CubicO group peptidase (beta-lactamase class C family)